MKEINVLGIDLAKRFFQLHGVNKEGRAVLKKKVSRAELSRFVVNLPKCLIAMEACSGAHFWAREFKKMGHEVKLIAPQFVKPFVKSNKNDAADAEAIVEAALRPSMRFVAAKEIWHQNIQCLHRVRSRMIESRVRLTNEVHGLLHEYGIVVPLLKSKFLEAIVSLLDPACERLPVEFKKLLQIMVDEYREVEGRIETLNEKVKKLSKENEVCRRLQEIPGVGPLVSTALHAAIVDPKSFRNGREVAAWLGLVPKQHSSGGKEVLLGISKRGDPYLRKILVHGARTVVYHAEGKTDRLNKWILEKERTRGRNRTVVAVANKTARIAWAIMARGEGYRVA
jgi:transposase